MKQAVAFFFVGFVVGVFFGIMLVKLLQKDKLTTITKEPPVERIIEKHDTILINKKPRVFTDTIIVHGEQIVKEIRDTIVDTFFVPIETKQYTETKENKQGTFVVDIEYRGAYAGIKKVDLQTHIKPRRWSIGVQGGVGVGYDCIHNNFSVGPYIGVGIAFNIFNF